MDKIARNAQIQFVGVVNKIIALLKGYVATHPEFDLATIQEALEYVIAHPESIATLDSNGRDVLGEALYGLPVEMLNDLISAAGSVQLAIEVNKNMKKKYDSSKELDEMFQNEEEDVKTDSGYHM